MVKISVLGERDDNENIPLLWANADVFHNLIKLSALLSHWKMRNWKMPSLDYRNCSQQSMNKISLRTLRKLFKINCNNNYIRSTSQNSPSVLVHYVFSYKYYIYIRIDQCLSLIVTTITIIFKIFVPRYLVPYLL